MTTASRALWLTGLLGLLAGCPPTGVYRGPDPVAQGHWQVAAAGAVGGMSDREQETRIPTGDLELRVRRGVAPDLDLGFGLYTFGLVADATWRIARGRWSWALAPALGGAHTRENGAITDAIHLFAGSALIAGRPLSKRWRLALGPSLGWGLYWPETGGHAQGGWLGGFVNADLRLGRCWHLTPELSAYRVVLGEVPVRGGAVALGLAVRWDR